MKLFDFVVGLATIISCIVSIIALIKVKQVEKQVYQNSSNQVVKNTIATNSPIINQNGENSKVGIK